MRCEKPFKVICPFDPAIDETRCSQEKAFEYARSRDMEVIRSYLKPNVKPMVFHLRPIAASLESWVDGADTPVEKNERAFAASCFHVDDLWNEDKTRISWTSQGADREDTTLTPAEMRRVPRICRQDIGQVALQRLLFLVPWIEPKYIVLDGSVLLSVQRYLSESPVDASQTSSTIYETESSSTEDSAATKVEGPGISRGAGASGEPIDATATGSAIG